VTAAECTALNELYNYNPLLFDLASKRLLRGRRGQSFPASVFKRHPLLPTHREYILFLIRSDKDLIDED